MSKARKVDHPPVPVMEARRNMITIAKAAEYAQLSQQTIRRYIAYQKLTGYRIGPKMIRIDLAELEALMVAPPSW
jgi:excisionase family DNA binding protein